MSKRILIRFLIPALLIAGAVLIWAWWPNGAKQAGAPAIAPMALVALALIVTFQSFLEEASDVPIAIWVIGVIMLAIGIALFFSNAIGMLGVLALIAVSAFFFFW
jgi:hypothetical protein